MKILIMSDSHGKNDDVLQAIEETGPVDMMIHLGDVERGQEYVEAIADCPEDQLYMVAGNCDYNLDLPPQLIVKIGKYRALLTHGHYFYVNSGYDRMLEYAAENDIQIIMHGHTHIPHYSEEDGVTIINPGSLSYPRQESRQQTYMVMELDEETGKMEYTQCVLRSPLHEVYGQLY